MKKTDPFQVEPLPKAFYYPSKEKELNKKEKKVCLSVPVGSQQQVTSPEDIKFLKETNTIKEAPTRENGSYADQSSSSQFNESWPSTEQAGSMGTPLSEGTVSSPEMSQQMREWLLGQDKPVTNTTLGWFINRFRNAAPSSRQHRDSASSTNQKQSDFWWLSPPSGQSTPVLDTPPQKLKPSPKKSSLQKKIKGPVATSSPVYQSDNPTEDLDMRAKDLLERSETSMETSSTEPFPLPLKKPAKQKPSEPTPRQSSTPSLPTKPTSHTTNNLPTSSLRHNPWPEDDILYQWRLARKMEKAQERASTMMGRKGVPALGVATTHSQPGRGVAGLGVHDTVEEVSSSLQEYPVLPVNSRPSEAFPREHFTATLEPQTASTSTAVSQAVGLSNTSPVNMVTTHTLTTPIATPMLSHPCKHLESTTMDSHTSVPPHMHLACDILPCPCTETVSKPKSQEKSQENEKWPRTGTLNHSERKKKTGIEKLSQDSNVNSEEKENPNEEKCAEIQGIREPGMQTNHLRESKTSVRTIKRHPDTNGMTNEKGNGRKEKVHQMEQSNGNKRNKTSDMVENVIGKVVSEHLFCSDMSSSDSSCRGSVESQPCHGDDGDDCNMASSTPPQENLLAESSEEEFAEDEILEMLKQRSKDLKNQLREIDNLLAHNKTIKQQ